MNAMTSCCVTSWPTRWWIWCRRRMWWKQVAEVLAMCCFTVSSESRSRTLSPEPISWMTLLGWILLGPTWSDWFMRWSLARLERNPNQIVSVLSAFNCNLREAHHLVTSYTLFSRYMQCTTGVCFWTSWIHCIHRGPQCRVWKAQRPFTHVCWQYTTLW